MIQGLLATKETQTQAVTEDGKRIPVTVVVAGPCWVTKITDGGTYKSLQLAFGSAKHILKAQEGHIKKAGLEIKPRFLREIRVSEVPETVKVGSELKVADVFAAGDKIMITGTSKGKGFAGVVKRHGFKGGPRTHGQSDRERAPGSIGQTTTPGRVYRGKRMAGRMGSDRVTVRGLEVVSIDSEKNIMQIKGLVPGSKNGLLLIQKEV
jgi:large subunit ribosomal protein L3